MPYEDQLSPVERELETQLAGLRPAGHTIERDTLMFRAGQRTAARRVRRWQAATGLMALALVGLWLCQPLRPRLPDTLAVAAHDPSESAPTPLRVIPPVMYPRTRQPTGSPSRIRHYLELRSKVITEGVDALPSPRPVLRPGEEPMSIADWRIFASLGQAAVPARSSNL